MRQDTLQRRKRWPRRNGAVCVGLLTVLGACATPVNKPLTVLPRPQFQAVPSGGGPIRVAVRTSYAGGTQAVHLKRANPIATQLAEHLNSAGQPRIEWFAVKQFQKLEKANYDYLLELSCKEPEHQTRRNAVLLAICWPATLSIIFSPLGIIGLSIQGVVKESTEFHWQMAIVPKHYEEALCLCKEKLDPLKAKVSASGWGTPQSTLEKSYVNTESHLHAAVVECLNGVRWDKLQEETRQYAAAHPTTKESKQLAEAVADTSNAGRQPTTPVGPLERRFAVVIGISKYKYAPVCEAFDDLLYASDDARAVAAALTQGGWPANAINVLVDEKATKRHIEIALESWLTKAGPNDLIVLFWAGHGYPNPGNSEQVYFACHDTDIRVPATGLRVDRVAEMLRERNARNVVVLADTCHAGRIIVRGERALAVVPDEKNIPTGWVYMVAAESDRKAIEKSTWKHGAFTHCLLCALKGEADGFGSADDKDGCLTLGEVRAFLRLKMPDKTLDALGVAKHPVIATSSADPAIWKLPLCGRKHARPR